MDVNDSFSSFYPTYFNNQASSVSTWSPNMAEQESMGTPAKGKLKSESEFDYHVLVESLINGKNAADKVHANAAEAAQGAKRSGSAMDSLAKNINWSDFDGNYLTKSLTRQFAKTALSASQPDLLAQLQADWKGTNGANNTPVNTNGAGPLNVPKNLNSVFSRILEEGYETRLNSSRSSAKSTYRTRSSNVSGNDGNITSRLVNNLAYNQIGGSTLLNNNLINNQLINTNLAAMGALNQGLASVNGLGNNINAHLLRNHLINNQLLNRQLLGNQLLNSQVLASQNLFPNPGLAGAFRNMVYNNDMLVNGQFGGNGEYVPGDFIAPGDYLQNGVKVDPTGLPINLYDYHGYGYNKFCKPLMKSQYNFKNFKGRQVRKKRNKAEIFPLPSLKESEFDRAVEYLKETLISLYRDQIMPIYFNVRGRFIEFNSDEIAPEHIMDICKRKPEVFNVVSNGALNETFIYLVEEPSWFIQWVDRNDLTDIYEHDMWVRFFEFIKTYKDEEGNEYFPGSIYGMSRVMQKLDLPFLKDMSLGTICHIVQLAIRLKKYLVYDLKTLKPSEAVRNGPFFEVTQPVDPAQQPVKSEGEVEASQAPVADAKADPVE